MPTLFGAPERYAAGLKEIAPRTHAWLQPNGSWGESNAGLVVGDGESLLIDTLFTPSMTRRMLDAMQAHIEGAPISRVVNTHGDGDHWWGNELLADREIVATAAAAEEMRETSPAAIGRLRGLGRVAKVVGSSPVPYMRRGAVRATGDFFLRVFEPYDFSGITATPATRTFEGSLKLEAGGREIELIEVGPAHTAGDLIVHVPDVRVVFAADVVFLGSTPIMWAGPVERWLTALDRIQALEPDVVVPGHGPLTDAQGIEVLREFWLWLESATRRGRSAAEILASDDYRSKPWADWEAPERIVANVHMLRRQNGGPVGLRERVRLFAAMGQAA